MTVLTALLWRYPYYHIGQNRAFIQDWLYNELGLTTDRLMFLLIGLCIALLSLIHLATSRSADTF